MGFRPVALETQAEVVFKVARQINCEQGPRPRPDPVCSSSFRQLGQVASLTPRQGPCPSTQR